VYHVRARTPPNRGDVLELTVQSLDAPRRPATVVQLSNVGEEDRQVFAVTGFFLGDAPICYAGQHATPVINGQQTADRLSQTTAPWFTLEADDQVNAQAIDAFAKDGAVKGGKIGIVYDGNSKALYDNIVTPALKKHKVDGTAAQITAPQGDQVAIDAQSPIIERFESAGVKKILVVGSTALQLANVLGRTDYRPQLIVLNSANLRSFTQNPGSDLDVVKNAISANVATNFNEPGEQQCFDVVKKATGYNIQETAVQGQPDYRSLAEIACRSIALFAAIAKAAGKKLTVQSFGKAPAKAGAFDIPGSGKLAYDTKKKRFVQPVYIYRYDPATKLVVQDPKPSA
jgi:hypothetical protein